LTVDLTGKVAVITGGGSGIGSTLARRFAASGAKVVLGGRRERPLQQTAEMIRAAGGASEWVCTDVSKPADVDRLFERAVASYGGVDILLNNAGIAGPTAALADVSLEQWDEVLAINLTGVFLCCKAALPLMRARGGGRIINIGSGSGKRPLPLRTPYTTSKLGLVGLTRTLAHEVGMDGITVNVISPFLVAGERLDLVVERLAKARKVKPEVVREELTALSPFHEGVSEDDVAGTALYLASEEGAHMTGQDINVSSGAIMF